MKDYSHNYKEGRGPSRGHKSNSDKLPDGRNAGQKSISEIPHNYKPGPGSPKPTDSNAR